MKKSFEFTPREIEDDIRAQVSRVFHEARWIIARLILPGTEIKSPSIEETIACPLAAMMRDVFDHAAGIREVPEAYSTCKQLLRILFGKAAEIENEIPPLFWATPLGAAIHECSGSLAEVSDDEELTETEAARLLGVGQLTLLGYCQSGEVAAQRNIGHRRIFAAGQIREFRRR